jgi:DNA-binding SARP family transcriptional activator/TolB-like protein
VAHALPHDIGAELAVASHAFSRRLAMQQPYRLVTLGALRLERADGGVVTGVAAQQRALVVLAAIALAGVKGVSRDWLSALLWPESDEERARHVLAQILYNLRRGLGTQSPIAATGRQLWLDLSVVRADVRVFLDGLREGDDAGALAAYGGPFLDGVHLAGAPATLEEWIDRERARLAGLHRTALAREAERLEAAGEGSAVASLRRRLVEADPLDSPATLRLMEVLASCGDAVGAIEAAKRHAALRRSELDVPPDGAVEALSERIRRAADARAAAESASRATPVPAAIPESGEDAFTDASGTVPLASAAPPEPRPRRTRSRAWLAAALVALMALGAFAGARAFRSSGASGGREADAHPAPPRSVAVLPFATAGNDTASRYLGDAIAAELLQSLQRSDSLQVASRSMSFALRDSALGARDVGRRLRVASVVEGTVHRVGSRVRVAVQLVSAVDGYTAWSATYEPDGADLMQLQERIAADVARALDVRLAVADTSRRPATDAETYDLYLRGRYAWWNATTLAGQRSGEALFRRAIARDSAFAPAYVGLADALFEQTAFHAVAPRTVVPQARAALERALALDPALADAHASLGYLLTFHEWRWDEADVAFRQAIALDPRHTNARLWRAWLLSARRRHPEAVAEMRRAQALDPFDPFMATRVATMLYLGGDWPASIARARQVLTERPGYWLAQRQLGEALVQNGDHDAGVAELRAAFASEPTSETRARLAYGLARAGQDGEARTHLAALERESRTGYVTPVELARVRLGLGDREGALADLARARADGASALVIVSADPCFAPLRDDARFVALLPASRANRQ